MTVSTSKLAYDDCYQMLDRALETPNGIRVPLKSSQEAVHYRTRLHMARKLDRIENIGIYPPDDPMHGRSEYDKLITKIKHNGSNWWVYIQPIKGPEEFEEVEEDE